MFLILTGLIMKGCKLIEPHKYFIAYFRAAFLSFLWATSWLFNIIIYGIPVLNRFRWPFKIAFFLDFYLIIIACLILIELVKKIRNRRVYAAGLVILISLQITNFIVLYGYSSYRDFGEHHGDPLPLEENLTNIIIDGRIFSAGFDIWIPSPNNDFPFHTAPTMGYNYATLWGLDYFAGYEPLISFANSKATLGMNFTAIFDPDEEIPVDYLRKAGVKWYLIPNDCDRIQNTLNSYHMKMIYHDPDRKLFLDAQALPMIYTIDGGKITSIESYTRSSNTIEVLTNNNQPSTIYFNYLFNPFFEAYIDGKQIQLTKSDDIHMKIDVPSGNHNIKIKYCDPYFTIGTRFTIIFISVIVIYFLSRLPVKAKD